MRVGVPILLAAAVAVSAAIAVHHAPAPLPTVQAAPSGPRIRYPAGRYPLLTLPDGRRQEVRSLLNVERPIRFGGYVWDEAGAPAGPVWIRVDLARQTLSVFRAGHEIGAAVILYGADGKSTPIGVFPIIERAEHHRSTLYEAEMPYMLRLTNDGVAIHASDVRASAATHGCIGVPFAFARKLFAQVKRGDIVAIIGAPPPVAADRRAG